MIPIAISNQNVLTILENHHAYKFDPNVLTNFEKTIPLAKFRSEYIKNYGETVLLGNCSHYALRKNLEKPFRLRIQVRKCTNNN
jgi:hypothetical protein